MKSDALVDSAVRDVLRGVLEELAEDHVVLLRRASPGWYEGERRSVELRELALTGACLLLKRRLLEVCRGSKEDQGR